MAAAAVDRTARRSRDICVTLDDPQATAFLAGVAEVCAEQGRAMTILPVTDTGADDATFPVTRERLLGYRDAVGDVGADWEDVLVGVCATNDAREARAMAGELMSRTDRPDALAAMSDELASGAFRAMDAAGLHVPGDVTLTGWDDAEAARALGITSVAQSMREQGAACARYALMGTCADFSDRWHVVERASTRHSTTTSSGGPLEGEG